MRCIHKIPTSLIWSKVILRLISNGMTTPFGIRHVSSTTAGSCASPGLSAQKLYLYALGMLPCTMMNNKIGTPSGTSNTDVRWASTTYVRTSSHHRVKRERYQRCLLNRSCRLINLRFILPICGGKRKRGVVTSSNVAGYVAVYYELRHTQPRDSTSGSRASSHRGRRLTSATCRKHSVSTGASFQTGPIPRTFTCQDTNNHYRLHVITMQLRHYLPRVRPATSRRVRRA